MGKKLKIKAKIGERIVEVVGREAETLLRLIAAGAAGISPLDAHKAGPAFRVAAYCFDIRTKHHIPIETKREAHEGGWHVRYYLTVHVEIIERNDLAQQVAA